MNQLEKVIIDADVCINLSRYGKVNALRCVLENPKDAASIKEKYYLLRLQRH